MIAMERRLCIRGITVRMLYDGSGPLIVFLHGAGGVLGWPDYLGRLATHHTIWQPEHPGFGASEDCEDIRSFADLAEYYEAFLDGLDARSVHLVGSSVGGWLAADLASRLGRRVKTLTLIGPAGMHARDPGSIGRPPLNEEEYVRRLYVDQAIADWMLSAPDDELRRQQIRSRRQAARLGGPTFHDPQLREKLSLISAPTLVLWGQQDQLVPPSQAVDWCSAIPRHELRVLPACGHLPHLERAHEVAEVTLRFVAEHG